MSDSYAELKNNVRKLGLLLGETIEAAQGKEILDKVEHIRSLSKKAQRENDPKAKEDLIKTICALPDHEMILICRAFNQFLNLTNIAEQHHIASHHFDQEDELEALFEKLDHHKADKSAIKEALDSLNIELVLTAHPTEIGRRTMINKWLETDKCLSLLEHPTWTKAERKTIEERLEQLIAQAWHSDVFREERPTPIDEAKWMMAVIENSLWNAVPLFMRRFNEKYRQHFSENIPLGRRIVHLTSWVGGDRDGNPFVTHKLTEEILKLNRIKATQLYLKDIQTLIHELSIIDCNEELKKAANGDREPYRYQFRQLRAKLLNTIEYLKGETYDPHIGIITTAEQLRTPLMLCYQSLMDCNLRVIANGLLLDLLLRIEAFGTNLVRLDIRQESSRHMQVFSELTRYLGLGDYGQWSEEDKINFLVTELNSKRPLISPSWKPSADVQEILDTCQVIAKQSDETFGSYVISMARSASDVLAVQLLLKETGCPFKLGVCPLFETLDDLNHAEKIMKQLFAIDWYRGHIHREQMVMIGYSDSAKDAGVLAAGWAQYTAMEKLVDLCEKEDIKLTLFHGRGGSVGRGGAPAHAALLSQPPKSLKQGLRVTEQGEMIRFKLGLPTVAVHSLSLYASAILEANLLPPPEPKEEWRILMDELSESSCTAYRNIVRGEKDFVPYFRSATPELELGQLPLGSRPAKRNPKGGVESLRAIPWIFSWTQNRLVLPSWLGAGEAIEESVQKGNQDRLEKICKEWPFFSTRLGMLNMVYMKSNSEISALYDEILVDPKLQPLGDQLRTQLQKDIQTILNIENTENLMENDPWGLESISLRNIYVTPLNILQIELLSRTRKQSEQNMDANLKEAMMVTIAGIAAGMRNTG